MSSITRKATHVIGMLLMLGGLVMMVFGFVAWHMVSSELASQKINVASEGQDVKMASGPFDALSQINLIKTHVHEGVTNFGLPAGTVYAEIPMPDSGTLAACKADATMAQTADCKTAIADDAARSYLDNANFKQASLYTSILAFGVSALVIGLGLALILIGWTQWAKSGKKRAAAQQTVAAGQPELAAAGV